MPNFQDAFSLSIATTTAPPKDDKDGISSGTTLTAGSYNYSQASVHSQLTTDACPPSPPQAQDPLPKKRGRKPEFTVFIDPVTVSDRQEPVSRKKTNSRIPLAVKSSSANSTPSPPPRPSDTPFPRSTGDPWWEDAENYDPRPFIMPPSTPAGLISTQSPSPAARPHVTPRTTRPRRAKRPFLLPTPRSMMLYNLLKLENWNASTNEIKMAWRRVALGSHPDKVAEEHREAATLKMQELNAARDLLSDRKRRHRYHLDGKLPWIL